MRTGFIIFMVDEEDEIIFGEVYATSDEQRVKDDVAHLNDYENCWHPNHEGALHYSYKPINILGSDDLARITAEQEEEEKEDDLV